MPVIEFVIFPAVTVAEPELTAREVRAVELAIRSPPETVTTLAEPPVRLEVPVAETVRLPRMALAVKFPEVTLERPVTVADPPVRFVVPQDEMVPIVPAVSSSLSSEKTCTYPGLSELSPGLSSQQRCGYSRQSHLQKTRTNLTWAYFFTEAFP